MRALLLAIALVAVSAPGALAQEDEPLFLDPIDVKIPHVSTDPDIRLDYDIVYVRAARAGDEISKRFYTDFSQPVTFESGADPMLLHPDGSEELLVSGGKGSVTVPFMSFDGQWVYYSKEIARESNERFRSAAISGRPPRQTAQPIFRERDSPRYGLPNE